MGADVRYSDDLKSAIARAEAEATLLKHQSVGVHHILAGLASGTDRIAQILKDAALPKDSVHAHVVSVFGMGPMTSDTAPVINKELEDIIGRIIGDAAIAGQVNISTEDFVDLLLAYDSQDAEKLLKSMGVTRDELRSALKRPDQADEAEAPEAPEAVSQVPLGLDRFEPRVLLGRRDLGSSQPGNGYRDGFETIGEADFDLGY